MAKNVTRNLAEIFTLSSVTFEGIVDTDSHITRWGGIDGSGNHYVQGPNNENAILLDRIGANDYSLAVKDANVWKTVYHVGNLDLSRYMTMTSGTYWQLGTPTGSTSSWLRTTANGLLPSANGVSSLGTNSWKFDKMYSINFNLNDNVFFSLDSSNGNRIAFNSQYGTVGIGMANASWCHMITQATDGFYFYDDISVPEFTRRSDRNMKDNIEYLTPYECYQIMSKVRPCTYTWKGKTKTKYGVIAQDLLKVNRNLVDFVEPDEDKPGHYVVDYDMFAIISAGAIQWLSKPWYKKLWEKIKAN